MDKINHFIDSATILARELEGVGLWRIAGSIGERWRMSVSTITSVVCSSVLGAVIGCNVVFERTYGCLGGHSKFKGAPTAAKLISDLVSAFFFSS